MQRNILDLSMDYVSHLLYSIQKGLCGFNATTGQISTKPLAWLVIVVIFVRSLVARFGFLDVHRYCYFIVDKKFGLISFAGLSNPTNKTRVM